MYFGKYVEEHLIIWILQIFLMILLSAFLFTTGSHGGIILTIDLVWLLIAVIYINVDFYKRKIRFRELWDVFDQLDEKFLLTEVIKKPENQIERIYFDLNRSANKAMLDEIDRIQTISRDYKEYIERWIHEVKTPITAADLLCKNHPSNENKGIQKELKKIDGLVEQALYYARSDSVEKDYFVKSFPLIDAVLPALQNYRSIILEKHITLDIEELSDIVYSDKKWVSFILEQLIANAVKYVGSTDGKIHMYSQTKNSSVWLFIEDNGAGITSADLPRVFEKGFTGSSRNRKAATGMGLYLCHKLCHKLGLHIEISSDYGKGTTVKFGFPAGNMHQLN